MVVAIDPVTSKFSFCLTMRVQAWNRWTARHLQKVNRHERKRVGAEVASGCAAYLPVLCPELHGNTKLGHAWVQGSIPPQQPGVA